VNPLEQLGRRLVVCRGAAARLRRTLKRLTRRAERRLAKRLLDEAPPRKWKGYAD
jgi:hypothetical protein